MLRSDPSDLRALLHEMQQQALTLNLENKRQWYEWPEPEPHQPPDWLGGPWQPKPLEPVCGDCPDCLTLTCSGATGPCADRNGTFELRYVLATSSVADCYWLSDTEAHPWYIHLRHLSDLEIMQVTWVGADTAVYVASPITCETSPITLDQASSNWFMPASITITSGCGG